MSNGKRIGRPKRVVLHCWTGLSTEELSVVRKVNDGRLRSNQLIEIDGVVACRGTGVIEGEDVETVAWDENQAAASFANSLVWDGYVRSVDASAELQTQLRQANDQLVAQAKQIATLTVEHQKQLSSQAAEHNKQLNDLLDEMLKFKVSLLKSGPAATTIDVDSLGKLASTITEAIINGRK